MEPMEPMEHDQSESTMSLIWPVLFLLALGTIIVFRLNEDVDIAKPVADVTDSVDDDGDDPYRGWGRAPDIKATTLVGPGQQDRVVEHPELVVTTTTVIDEPVVDEPKERSYIVARDDTLGEIALKMYGSTRHTDFLQRANGITDPDRLSLGQVLRVPDLPVAPVEPAPDESRWVIHEVRDGENAWKIAKKYYGNGNDYRKLIEDNLEAFSGGETDLAPGTRLKIRR